jgi:hypothetical protein
VWLVLCEPWDLSAFWAYRGLMARGLRPLELFDSTALAASTRWTHVVGPSGTDIEITLADQRGIHGSEVCGALNRLVSVNPPQIARAAPADREYAAQEFYALFLSWLHCLPGAVVNRPSPLGLSGRWHHRPEWEVLAARAGLRTVPYREGSHGTAVEGRAERHRPVCTAIVTGDEVIGAPPDAAVRDACRSLRRLSGMDLLGIELAEAPDGDWTFRTATPHPDLSVGGEPLLDVLADVLKGRPGGLEPSRRAAGHARPPVR